MWGAVIIAVLVVIGLIALWAEYDELRAWWSRSYRRNRPDPTMDGFRPSPPPNHHPADDE